jgi:oligosaccharyltransferase complex subunit delta (ribophorin II)
LKKPLVFGSADTLKLLLTTQQNGSPKLAHQSFLLLKDPVSGLDISYPLSVKENGKAKLELVRPDSCLQFAFSNSDSD